MKWPWSKQQTLLVDTEGDAEDAVELQALTEQQRRQWCVEQAAHSMSGEAVKSDTLLRLAHDIYEYVFGVQA